MREALVAARDALAAFQKDAGWLPEQQAYSTKLTDAERKLADAVSSIDAILAAPLPRSEPQPPAVDLIAHHRDLLAALVEKGADRFEIRRGVAEPLINALMSLGAIQQPAAGTGGVPPAPVDTGRDA